MAPSLLQLPHVVKCSKDVKKGDGISDSVSGGFQQMGEMTQYQGLQRRPPRSGIPKEGPPDLRPAGPSTA